MQALIKFQVRNKIRSSSLPKWGDNFMNIKVLLLTPEKSGFVPQGLLGLNTPFWGLLLMFVKNFILYVVILIFMVPYPNLPFVYMILYCDVPSVLMGSSEGKSNFQKLPKIQFLNLISNSTLFPFPLLLGMASETLIVTLIDTLNEM